MHLVQKGKEAGGGKITHFKSKQGAEKNSARTVLSKYSIRKVELAKYD